MGDGLEPTEQYDGTVTVRVYDDDGRREEIDCSSYEAAIETVRKREPHNTVVEIVDREGDIVFDSVDMNIDDWEAEWTNAKRQLSVDVETRECPYDNVACFADDLCVKCKIDKVRNDIS